MLNTKDIKTYSIKKRFSKVKKEAFARVCSKKSNFCDFIESLPGILKANDFRALVKDIISARRRNKPVIFMFGAHVIKCGLSPLIIDLIQRKMITTCSLNGAGIIHDFEIAYQGSTSEDVGEALKDGSFGMSRETGEFLNNAINIGVRNGLGIGEAVGKAIHESHFRYKKYSIAYNCYSKGVPLTVHVAIGTDIIHQHPSFDASLTGRGSGKDFLTLAESISKLSGGVVLNIGSAVVLPEVFLKALNLARNLGNKVYNFTTANFDMNHHYRPQVNIVQRPTQGKGKGYYIVGHHEIMIPLLHRAIVEYIG